MDRTELHSLHHRQISLIQDERRLSLPSKLSIASKSNPSISSLDSNGCSLTNNNQSSEDRPSLINASSCKVCRKSHSLDHSDTCLQCHENQSTQNSKFLEAGTTHLNSNQRIGRSRSFNIFHIDRKTPVEKKRDKIPVERKIKNKKKLNHQSIIRSLSLYQKRLSLPDLIPNASINACIQKFLIESRLTIDTTVMETIKCSQSISVSPTLHLSTEHINYYRQRQLELNRSVHKLIESLKTKTKETISQISKHWSCLKQLSLNQLYPRTNLDQIVDYLFKSSCSMKQFELYLEEKDDIKAVFQVLSITLTIINNKYSSLTISQLFNREEKSMSDKLNDQLEFLLSSYVDELSFISEGIHFHQSRPDGDKCLDWIKFIKEDYVLLLERISNDFITKIPQIDQILIQMLRNMKKRLLNIDLDLINER